MAEQVEPLRGTPGLWGARETLRVLDALALSESHRVRVLDGGDVLAERRRDLLAAGYSPEAVALYVRQLARELERG